MIIVCYPSAVVRTLRAIFCTLTLIVATFASLPTAGARQSAPLLPITILVSIDGWRWDYIDRFAPDAIGRLARAGVRAEGLIPISPRKHFPITTPSSPGNRPRGMGSCRTRW